MTDPVPPRGRFPLRLAQVQGGAVKPGNAARPVSRPQSPVRDAHAQGQRSTSSAARPEDVGLHSSLVRERLLQRLQAQGLRDPRVLAALRAVPRHAFVDTALAAQAYEDTSLPIGLGQTISKPSVVARMIELLIAGQAEGKPLRWLEIGTGCGYQAAVLAQLARFVVSIERLKPLHDKARANLAALELGSLRLVYGDGRLGHAPNAPYDGIIAAAGGEELPAAWLDQLAPGGRLVAPMLDGAPGAGTGRQILLVIDRAADGGLTRTTHEAVKFVPLKSGLD